MVTQATYIEYLLRTPRNYTCTHLAEHLSHVSHDQVNRFLRRSSFSPTQLRELVLPLLDDSPEAFLLVDDSVQVSCTLSSTSKKASGESRNSGCTRSRNWLTGKVLVRKNRFTWSWLTPGKCAARWVQV